MVDCAEPLTFPSVPAAWKVPVNTDPAVSRVVWMLPATEFESAMFKNIPSQDFHHQANAG
jgi:hypothetical protein